jgi:bacterioferritin-associated ferredoxin
MIICLCAGVPENKILAAIERGVCCVEDLAKDCGAGRDCGACIGLLEALLPESAPLVQV